MRFIREIKYRKEMQNGDPREWSLYRGPVLRHSAELIQAANFRSAVAF